MTVVRVFLASVFGLSLTTALCAQPTSILIDNFNQGTGGSSIGLTLNANGSAAQLYTGLTATTIGNQRIARLHHVTGTGTVNLNNTVNPDVLGMSLPSSSTIEAHFHLYYGYDNYDPAAATPVAGTHTFRDLNVDASVLTGALFEFELIRLDVAPTDLFATLVSDRGGANEAFRRVMITRNSGNLTPVTIALTQADFAAGTGSGTLN